MELMDSGVVFEGEAGTPRASNAFPSLAALADGRVMVACRQAVSKDRPACKALLATSDDGGATWRELDPPMTDTSFEGVPGSIQMTNVSEVAPGRVLAVVGWIDRTRGDVPLFNPETEGLLPCKNLLYESFDGGATWSFLTVADTAPFERQTITTGPVLPVAPGVLAAFYETNKEYDDPRPWFHQSVVKFSHDGGLTWPEHAVVAADPTGQVFYWDQRTTVLRDNVLLTFLWTYDRTVKKDLPIHWTGSDDGGRTWSAPRDTGITGQVAYPAALADGRIVLAYVDRYHSHSIRVRLSADEGRSWEPDELVLWPSDAAGAAEQRHGNGMADYLQSMAQWTFGLPVTAALPDGQVFVVYYAGDPRSQSIHWARLAP